MTREGRRLPPTTPVLGWRDVRDEPTWIYGLADPRDGRIRYIGKSANPLSRLSSHARKGARKVCAWYAELNALGLGPCLVFLEKVPAGQDVDQREQAHLARFPCEQLLNQHVRAAHAESRDWETHGRKPRWYRPPLFCQQPPAPTPGAAA